MTETGSMWQDNEKGQRVTVKKDKANKLNKTKFRNKFLK